MSARELLIFGVFWQALITNHIAGSLPSHYKKDRIQQHKLSLLLYSIETLSFD
jgi:hypothetical protein